MVIDKPLKDTESLFDVTVRAFQDDATIAGKASVIYGENNAREYLIKNLALKGNRAHSQKAEAYGNCDEERLLIPHDVAQPHFDIPDNTSGEMKRVFGIVITGVPVGDNEFITEWLRRQASKIAERVEYVSSRVAAVDPHVANAITTFSLQTQGDFIMSTNNPSDTTEFSTVIDKSIEKAFALSLGSNLLDEELSKRGSDPLDDPIFIRDRGKLKAKKGGAAIRLTADREQFLNCLLNSIPQMTSHANEDGLTVSGFFENLADIIGIDSFKEENHNQRWSFFLEHGGTTADDFQREYLKGKTIHNSLISDLHQSDPNSLNGFNSIFQTPVEGFGAKLKKVQSTIQSERNDLSHKLLTQRAMKLHPEDPRRMAFLANNACPLACQLLGSLPHADITMSPDEWKTSVAIHMGVKVPKLLPYIGLSIRNSNNCPKLLVDPFSYNLSKVTGIKGGDTQINHNGIARLISETLQKSGIQHIGGITDRSCKHIFIDAIPQGDTDENGSIKIKSIIADLVIQSSTIREASTPLANADHIVDIKTLSAGHCYRTGFTTSSGVPVKERQLKVNSDYHNTAAQLDRDLHNTPADTIGPFKSVLLNYGKDSRVLGPVVGFFGEVSDDILQIRDLCVSEMVKQHCEIFRCSERAATGLFRNQLNRKWGHSFTRGWSRLVLNRLRHHVNHSKSNPNQFLGASEDQENESYLFFNPIRRRDTIPRNS